VLALLLNSCECREQLELAFGGVLARCSRLDSS
jgi:hypothetical protein